MGFLRPRLARMLVAALAAGAAPAVLGAQQLDSTTQVSRSVFPPAPIPSGVTRQSADRRPDEPQRFLGRAVPGRRIPPALAPVLSAVVPGSGQVALGQERGVVYAAVEVLAWLKQARDRRDLARHEADYRRLGRDVARNAFPSARPDGDWDYYESMATWLESGAYSIALDPGILRPETDSTTFNGSRWLIAQRNNGVDPAAPGPESAPAYQAALAEYARRAVRPEFRWSWRNAQLELDLYRRAISKRNDANKAITTNVTILLANHVLSLVDAFATYRLQVSASAADGLGVRWSVPVGR